MNIEIFINGKRVDVLSFSVGFIIIFIVININKLQNKFFGFYLQFVCLT